MCGEECTFVRRSCRSADPSSLPQIDVGLYTMSTYGPHAARKKYEQTHPGEKGHYLTTILVPSAVISFQVDAVMQATPVLICTDLPFLQVPAVLLHRPIPNGRIAKRPGAPTSPVFEKWPAMLSPQGAV